MSEDRNDPPGLHRFKQISTEGVMQVVEHFVESSAVHSKSEGWIPAVFITLHLIPMFNPRVYEEPQIVKLIFHGDAAGKFAMIVARAQEAAEHDGEIGYRED